MSDKQVNAQVFSGDSQGVGDEAFRLRERARKRKQWIIQGLLIGLLCLVVYALSHNVMENLQARHIRSGFGFLENSAGFDIGETVIEFSSSDKVWRALCSGVINTVRVALVSILTATILGVVVGVMRLARHPILRVLGVAHVEFYRNIPLIIQLLAIYLALTELLPMDNEALQISHWVMLSKSGLQIAVPLQSTLALLAAGISFLLAGFALREFYRRYCTDLVAKLVGVCGGAFIGVIVWLVFGFVGGWSHPELEGFAIEGGTSFSPEFLALWIGLTMFTSASIAEIVRAGILAVRPNQRNAGLALGMTDIQVTSYIVFPQAMRLIIPPLSSQFMNLTKNSSLAVVIGYPDLVAIGNASINVTGQALEIICIIMSVYLVLNLVTSVLMNALNAHVMRAPK